MLHFFDVIHSDANLAMGINLFRISGKQCSNGIKKNIVYLYIWKYSIKFLLHAILQIGLI